MPFLEGEVIDRAIGGGSYRVTRVVEATCPTCGDTVEYCGEFREANRYK